MIPVVVVLLQKQTNQTEGNEMRVFKVVCTDAITNYEMILSECSYNMACDWLERTLNKYGIEIYDCKVNSETGFMELAAGKFSESLGEYKLTRRYFYDEIRGILLGE